MPSVIHRRKPGRCHAARHNWRNRAKQYEGLLMAACRRLDEYFVEMPVDVASWWKTRTFIQQLERSRNGQKLGPKTTLSIRNVIGSLARQGIIGDLETFEEILDEWEARGKRLEK
jgi:hypothetical protein